MGTIRLNSRVGVDGVLHLTIPMGAADANAEVVVTIQPANGNGKPTETDWHEFVTQTYGSCVGMGLEEPADLPVQEHEWPQ